jgi:hypothetical protein
LIRQASLLALAALSFGQIGMAGVCSVGTLASYVSLGAGGCTIGNNTLYDFKVFTTGTAGATELAAGLVNLTPSGSNYDPSLALSVNQMATAPTALETFFTYDIKGAGLVGTLASLSGSSATVDGAVSGIENYCLGGNFGPDGVDGCPGTNGALVTLALDGFSQNTDSAGFSKVSFINVTNDFTLGGGISGTATGGTFTDSFAAVPEPAAVGLTGLGLLLSSLWGGAVRRRLLNKKQN